jgi:hypothetical protein
VSTVHHVPNARRLYDAVFDHVVATLHVRLTCADDFGTRNLGVFCRDCETQWFTPMPHLCSEWPPRLAGYSNTVDGRRTYLEQIVTEAFHKGSVYEAVEPKEPESDPDPYDLARYWARLRPKAKPVTEPKFQLLMGTPLVQLYPDYPFPTTFGPEVVWVQLGVSSYTRGMGWGPFNSVSPRMPAPVERFGSPPYQTRLRCLLPATAEALVDGIMVWRKEEPGSPVSFVKLFESIHVHAGVLVPVEVSF